HGVAVGAGGALAFLSCRRRSASHRLDADASLSNRSLRKLERDGVVRLGAHDLGILVCGEDLVAGLLQSQDLEQLGNGINKPYVRPLFGRIDGKLVGLHLADRSEVERGLVRTPRKALSAPAAEVGDEDVLAEVQLRLMDDDPPAWAAAPAIERAT